MFCSECGTKVNEGAKFCFNCGAKIVTGIVDSDEVQKARKEMPEEFILFVENKYIESYLENKIVKPDFFYKKAKFYEVEDEQVNEIVNRCEEKIRKLEKFITSIYEDCTLFELTEDEEDEIIGFGNSLGLDDEDIEELMSYYDERNHIWEKQELYSKCALDYISDGKTHIKRGNKIQKYQEEVYDLFEKNILHMEAFLKNQYEKTKDYELSQKQLNLIYSEGDKLFPKEIVTGIIFSYDNKAGILKYKEEKERQRALERMIVFNLYGEKVAYTEEETVGISVGKEYRKLFPKLDKEFEAFHNNTDRTKEGYWESANEKILRMIDTIYKAMIAELGKRGVSKEDISKINYMDIFKYWIPVFEDIDYQYNMICCGAEAAEYYRRLRKETRGRLVGGGFGLEGAIKGIATAGAINMMSGAAHSAFNFIGDIKSEWKKLQAIKELLGYSLKEKVEIVLKKTLQWAYLTELEVLKNYNVSNKGFRLFYESKDNNGIASIKSLKENPFNENIYESIIMTLGIDAEIDKIAKFTEIDIREIKAKRKQKEQEERTEDGIVFSTVLEKETYCKERDIYKPLIDEIKKINIWADRQMFTEKVNNLKKMDAPSVIQWKKERDNILEWCQERENDFNTPNEIYLSKVMKVATNESWQETVVREGHSNYNALLEYFDNVLKFESDEKVILFITSYKSEPSQALIFGTKHNYYVKSEQKIQFDFEQLRSIKYEVEKGFILNDKITCLEIKLDKGNLLNVTSLFSSRGSSNYAISDTFVGVMNECVEIVMKKRNQDVRKKSHATGSVSSNIGEQEKIKKGEERSQRRKKDEEWKEMYDLAVKLEEKPSTEADVKKALEIYEELAKNEIPLAQWRLARFYNNGDVVKKDQTKALNLFKQAAEKGCAEAQSALGNFYSSVFSHSVETNDKYAVELYKKAAEKGELAAQCNLAIHYFKGLGVEENKHEAIRWWIEAARHGSVIAQYNLGQRYEYGEGVERSKEKALYWYNEAGKQGYKKAIESAQKLNGGCYITTAVCMSFGKEDDCYELQAFRRFRDDWLKYQDGGEKLIREYYKTAPQIVERIEERGDAKDILKNIWDEYLKSCLDYIEKQEYEKCKELYIAMVMYMKEEYMSRR